MTEQYDAKLTTSTCSKATKNVLNSELVDSITIDNLIPLMQNERQ